MTLYDYEASQQLLAQRDWPFYALIMAAMRKADSDNATRLREAFPWTYDELYARYNAPGGVIKGDPEYTDGDSDVHSG